MCFVQMSSMSQQSHLTESETWRVDSQLEEGLTCVEVSKPTGFSQSVIGNVF